ncbi:MAG: glycosyl transferase family 2 [Blastocatellia bacterium AA13]|nr:MAG: glycosyl transferase family 2 [Blastocatellia bacterium AA13]
MNNSGFIGSSSEQIELSIVAPVYRSEDCLHELVDATERSLSAARVNFEIILVNDGSPDNSWAVIEGLCSRNSAIVGIDLRKNFGQDNAILTGLRLARGSYVAIMDDDLQHDPAELPAMLERIREGYDVVYADFRVKRQRLWKNIGSWLNGKVAQWVLDKPKHIYLSPYKVISREAAELICRYEGPDPYIDGLLLQVTSRVTQAPAEHHDRYAGQSAYTFWKSVRVGARLAFSFSSKPLRLVTWFGFIFAVLGLILTFVVIGYRVFFPEDFPPVAVGWASLMVAILLIGGIQMVFFGILGEYAGRTYLAVNRKPQTAVRKILNRGEVDLPTAHQDEIGAR